eukprot:TRINITY_DN3840_c0_g3_i1.p1 TRINITY_DN3840_c0_g3~~TRINITY_DN3840_c0_g3_i1.p1  ORF type:complete len:350 (+),score=92.77 TRINITY_DN3840_c0_g3_i1:649-1698(+)
MKPLNLSAVQEFQALMTEYLGPGILLSVQTSYRVDQDLKACFASLIPNPYEMNEYFLLFCEKYNLDLAFLNKAEHNVQKDMPKPRMDNFSGGGQPGQPGPAPAGFGGPFIQPAAGGYPGQPAAYPYPQQIQSGYLPGQPGYPGQPAYPPQPGYPGQLGYPPGQPAYPSGQPAYPTGQPMYPGGQPGYPTGAPGGMPPGGAPAGGAPNNYPAPVGAYPQIPSANAYPVAGQYGQPPSAGPIVVGGTSGPFQPAQPQGGAVVVGGTSGPFQPSQPQGGAVIVGGTSGPFQPQPIAPTPGYGTPGTPAQPGPAVAPGPYASGGSNKEMDELEERIRRMRDGGLQTAPCVYYT